MIEASSIKQNVLHIVMIQSKYFNVSTGSRKEVRICTYTQAEIYKYIDILQYLKSPSESVFIKHFRHTKFLI